MNASSNILGMLLTGAAAIVPQVRVEAPPFREWEPPRVETAGGEILGLVDANLKQSAPGQQILVSGLAPADRTICIAVTHVSGRYLAAVTLEKPRNASSLSIVLPGNRISALKAKRGELAILARASQGSSCSSADPVLPASWGREAISGSAYLMVNNAQSLRSRAALVGSTPAACVSLRNMLSSARALTTYQVACPVPVGGNCGETASFAVNLENGTRTTSLRGRLRKAC